MRAVQRPLVAHVVYRFDTGGLENGVANLIDRLDDYRHAVIALTEVVPAFARRVQRDDVAYHSLHKPQGQGWHAWPALRRALHDCQPDIVHTRNLAALEMQPAAWWSTQARRVHGEHGRDIEDIDGRSVRHQWLRRLYRPFVQHYVALSADLDDYLRLRVGVPARRITRIINGVDTRRFSPALQRLPPPGMPHGDPGLWVIGTVGRMQTVKAQPLLARAFVAALQREPALRVRLRLAMVGDGPLRAECEAVLREAGVHDLAWLPGARDDVPDVMRGLNCFVLPSLAEGISNTILEAMSCGLPVIATDVGGNAELVDHGRSGEIVAAGDPSALADAIVRMACEPGRAAAMGSEGRARAQARFSIDAMVEAYRGVYGRLLPGCPGTPGA